MSRSWQPHSALRFAGSRRRLAPPMVVAMTATLGCRGGRGGTAHDSGASGNADAGGADLRAEGGGAADSGIADAGAIRAIVVDTPSGQIASESWDGHCDLLEAIAAANSDRPVHECPAGNGADRILL